MSATRSEDRTLLRHLGQPFYFRHTPPLALRRGAFWLGFLLVAGIAVVNILLMPYPRESTAWHLRTMLGWSRGYMTFEAGAQGIASQFFVIATVLAGIVAPLYATYSLAMERVGGTIEFLKLSPMSTLSVVLGKMFAPAYLLHLFSGGLLLLAAVIGFFGGYGLGDLSLTLLSVVCATVTVHAAGAFLACATTAFRGFGPVVGLIGAGLLVYVLPFAAYYEAGLSYLRYLSPFSTMDTLFWQEAASSRWYGGVVDEFFGLQGALGPSVLLIHGTFAAVLVWAAARWFDHPEGTALPRKGYLILLGLIILVALGTVPNMDQRMTQGFLAQRQGMTLSEEFQRGGFFAPSYTWASAMLIVFFAGLAICLLLILDHPHRRELVQEEFSERAGGRETGPVKRLSHAFFAGAVTVGVLAAGLGCYTFTPFGGRMEPWTWAFTLAFGVWGAVFLSLILETAWVRYRSAPGRVAAAAVMGALLLGSLLYPVIDYAQKTNAFWIAYHYKQQTWQQQVELALVEKELAALEGIGDGTLVSTVTLPSAAPGAFSPGQAPTFNYYVTYYKTSMQNQLTVGQYRQQMADLRSAFRQQELYYARSRYPWSRENLERYQVDMQTPEALAALGTAMRAEPFAIILRYHASSLLWYPLLPLAASALAIWFRRRSYRRLEKEALDALKQAPPTPSAAALQAGSVSTSEPAESDEATGDAMPAAGA